MEAPPGPEPMKRTTPRSPRPSPSSPSSSLSFLASFKSVPTQPLRAPTITCPACSSPRSLDLSLLAPAVTPTPTSPPHGGGRGEMLCLRAFRPMSDKVLKIQLHPTHLWLVTADANDRVSIWDWEHHQVRSLATRDPARTGDLGEEQIHPWPPFRIGDVRAAVPTHCWCKSPLRSLSYVALVAALALTASAVDSWAL